jgi:prefoldin alpha subunit
MNEQELRQAMGTLEVYKAQLEAVAEQQQLIQMSLEEYSRAKDTLTEFAKAPENGQLLVPIGGNSYVYATVADNTTCLVGVGSGITVEKSIEESVQLMTVRVQEMLDAMKKMNETRNTMEMKSAQLQQIVQEEYQKMQSLQQQQPQF